MDDRRLSQRRELADQVHQPRRRHSRRLGQRPGRGQQQMAVTAYRGEGGLPEQLAVSRQGGAARALPLDTEVQTPPTPMGLAAPANGRRVAVHRQPGRGSGVEAGEGCDGVQFFSWDVDVAAVTVDGHAPGESVGVDQPDGIRRQWLAREWFRSDGPREGHDTVALTRRRREGGVGG